VLEKAGRQRELWFQLELFFLFTELKDKRIIESLMWECPATNGSCDFKLEFVDGTSEVIETKVEIQRTQNQQRKSNWELRNSAVDYAKKNNIPKMLSIPATSHHLLIFAYPGRPESEWDDLIEHIPNRLDKEGVAGVTVSKIRVDRSPGGELSIGWIQISTHALTPV
jgi:hypothetical protein